MNGELTLLHSIETQLFCLNLLVFGVGLSLFSITVSLRRIAKALETPKQNQSPTLPTL